MCKEFHPSNKNIFLFHFTIKIFSDTLSYQTNLIVPQKKKNEKPLILGDIRWARTGTYKRPLSSPSLFAHIKIDELMALFRIDFLRSVFLFAKFDDNSSPYFCPTTHLRRRAVPTVKRLNFRSFRVHARVYVFARVKLDLHINENSF